MIHFHVISLFPDAIASYVNESILARAQKNKKVKFTFYNPRDYTKDKHARVDRKPYGGGPGMVLQAGPIIRAAEKARGRRKNVKVIVLSAQGKQFTNAQARSFAKKYTGFVLIAGHYEGIDARVKKVLRAEEISIGPYVLTGGEAPAMVVVDAISRQIPGVLGRYESLEEGRTTNSEVYTRPEVLTHKGKKYRVPKVLLSGNHAEIEGWKRKIKKSI